ncbi:MAG: DNA endonuclease SmrA [Methylococcaceae bacterium]|nr:DNA endonuclease SmrA [Methylococcaceae bacterium]
MNSDDRQLFQQEMADVQPLKHAMAASPQRICDRSDPGLRYRREAAQRPVGGDGNFLTTAFVEFVHPQDALSFKRGGIQNGVFRKLQQGSYPIEATLDLHLLSVEEARQAVFTFVKDCVRYEVRTALINHGKGARSKENPALIKSYVARWLPQFEEIMALHSAQSFHGGTGAVYVMFRKSEKAKDQARERLGLSSGKPEF